jgi:cell wall-associated NlpC family hydrolase
VTERPAGRRYSFGAARAVSVCGAALLALALVGGAAPGTAYATFAPPPGNTAAPGAATDSGSRSGALSVPVANELATALVPRVAPLAKLHVADVIVAAKSPLPARTLKVVRRLSGAAAAVSIDAARIQVNGKYVAMIGVDPSAFRSFAARPTAASDRLWQNVAAGGIAVSYDMGRQDHLPLNGAVHVAGRTSQDLPVGGFATVGIGGIDAVVSHQTAMSLGLPAGNAIIVSARSLGSVAGLVSELKRAVPRGAAVQQLVFEVTVGGGAATVAGGASVGGALSSPQLTAMLDAALSRRGMPYVWGAEGPTSFDCSGLVQWSFAQAGIAMPRVAADQARTGPGIPFSQARPGDLLFWRTDPTAPNYISHVAIYLGNGWMIQAPQPGQNVEVVPVVFGSGFAGVVRVEAQVASSVAG